MASIVENSEAGPSKTSGRSTLDDFEMDGTETDLNRKKRSSAADPSSSSATHKKKKSKPSSSSENSPKPGIVYVSHLPRGMTPPKLRSLMEQWGDVGRVYAQRREESKGSSSKAKQKHQKADFTEAWVEFLDKRLAKVAAEMCNGQPVGGKKGDRWRDDVWTMKYLPGFKWEMLGEQMAYERQAHVARLRQELSKSKAEQQEYLKNVELARVLDKRRAKKAEREIGGGTVDGPSKPSTSPAVDLGSDKAKRKYKQREVIRTNDSARESKKTESGQISGLLDHVF